MEKKIYRIPQRLDREFQLGFFTIPELLLFLAALVGGCFLTAAGFPSALFVPAVLLVLHLRVTPDGRNVKQLLAIRIRYLKKEQAYGLQDCERKLKKKK